METLPENKNLPKPDILYLKGPYEYPKNLHDRLKCQIAGCKKWKNLGTIKGYRVCGQHYYSVKNGTNFKPEPYPTLLLPGGDTIEEQECHAKGCSVKLGLIMRHRGLFCKAHLEILGVIRANLLEARSTGNRYAELYYRKEEFGLRKYPDMLHSVWINQMSEVFE